MFHISDRFDNLCQSLYSCFNVVWALLVRDVKNKIFESGVIFLFSPILIQLAIQLFVFYVFKRKTVMGMNNVAFILSGYMPYLLFERILMENAMLFIQLKNSLAIKKIKVFDAILANSICWFFISLFLFLVSLLIAYFVFEMNIHIYDLSNIIFSFILMFFMGWGLGIVAAVIGVYMKNPMLFVLGFAKIFYFSAGVLFPLSAVPYQIRKYLLLNPLLHVVELDRYAFVATNVREDVNFAYPCLWALISLFIGFMVYLNFKDEFLKRAFE